MLFYRRLISPLYGNVCKYYPSCSQYALTVLQKQNFFKAIMLIIWRLLRCNPFSLGGVDDVAENTMQKQGKVRVTKRGFVVPVGERENT